MYVKMWSDCYNKQDDSTRYKKKKQIEPNQSTGQEKTTVDWTISYNLFLNSTFLIRTNTCQTSSMRRADIDNNLADADAI